jgi:protein ATS1
MPTLLACGSNGAGQLAIGHADDVATFTPCVFDPSCPPFERVVDLVSAASHALALVSADGRNHLMGAGTNTHGQLGKVCALDECARAATSFRPLSIARDAGFEGWEPVKVAATWTTSFVALESPDGSAVRTQVIVAAGSDDFGELGGGVIHLKEGERVEHLRGGQRHVLAVLAAGSGDARKQRVIGWGAARRGELDPNPQPSKGKGKARTIRTLPPTELPLDLPSPIIDISLGASHTLVLLANGRVLAWGNDLKGQITGLADASGVRAIGATWNGSYLLSDELWSQGSNTHGQLLRSNGGETRAPRASVPLDAEEVAAFAAGSEHILALARSRSGARTDLWAGGWNEHGNLGLGNTDDRAELVNTGVQASRVWAGCAASWALIE